MGNKQNSKPESGRTAKGRRYWSIMLVGEHGRVIPFKRFKEVVIAVACIIALSLSAALVLSVLYLQQTRRVDLLQGQLDDFQRQLVQLKDERDVLRAKLVIRELAAGPDASQTAPGEKTESPKAPSSAAAPSPPERKSPPAPTPTPAPPQVKWAADIRMFKADYDHQRDILSATFRIYNITTPRQRLSGKIVVAFKHANDPPIKWLVVPNVPLKEGRPATYAGHSFSINNYQTMNFRAYKPLAPTSYNIVTVYVLRSDGELLLSRDFAIKIEAPPTPTPTPTPTPAPTSTPSTTLLPQSVGPGTGSERTSDEAVDAKTDSVDLPATVVPEIPSSTTSGAPSAGPESAPIQGSAPLSIPEKPRGKGASMAVPDIPIDTTEEQLPTVEAQPKPEGETE